MVTRSTFGLDGQRDSSSCEDTGRGRFADGDRTGDADDEGRLGLIGQAEETLALGEQHLRGFDMRGQEPRQREVDAPDFVEIDRVVQRAQPLHFVGGQRQRRVGSEVRPFLRRKEPVGRIVFVSK